MPAGRKQQQIRKADIVREPRGEGMSLKVIDRDEGLSHRQRQRLGGCQPDNHAADQPRPGGGGDSVDIAQIDPRGLQRPRHQPVDHVDMGPCGDLRDDPAISGMRRDLA